MIDEKTLIDDLHRRLIQEQKVAIEMLLLPNSEETLAASREASERQYTFSLIRDLVEQGYYTEAVEDGFNIGGDT